MSVHGLCSNHNKYYRKDYNVIASIEYKIGPRIASFVGFTQ